MNDQLRERASHLFFALSNPSRLRITELVCQNEMSVNEICAALTLGQSATSQNLAILTRAGVLVVAQKGANRIYRVRGPRIPQILALIAEFCTAHELYGHVGDAENSEMEQQERE